MKRSIFLFSVFLVALLCSQPYDNYATHIVGGSISYKYVGPGSSAGTHSYLVRIAYFRDCAGINYSAPFERFQVSCMPGNTNQQTFTAYRISYQAEPGERPTNNGARDLSEVCSSKLTRCNGTNHPGGVEAHYYEAYITLPQCNFWQITSLSACCRSSAGNGGASRFENLAHLNNLQFPKNSSSIRSTLRNPIISGCVGQIMKQNFAVKDPDNDSLRYFSTLPGDSWRYNSGHSVVSPIPGFKLDSLTGEFQCLSNVSGRYLFAYMVEEYDRCTGQLKGRIREEVQISFGTCQNAAPIDTSGALGVSGVSKTASFDLEGCLGNTAKWHHVIRDPNASDSIRIKTNLSQVLPGAKYRLNYISSNHLEVHFEWTVKKLPNDMGILLIKASDDLCDYPGYTISALTFRITGGAFAGNDTTICQADTAYFTASKGVNLKWRSLYGDPIIPGVNWFADTTAQDTNRSVLFVPSRTTALELELTHALNDCGLLYKQTCKKRDTVIIHVADSFTLSTSPDQLVCPPGEGRLIASTTRNFQQSYSWSPTKYLSSSSGNSSFFSGVRSHTTFEVSATSDSGCVRKAEVEIRVADPFPNKIGVSQSDTLICLQKQVKMWVEPGDLDYGPGCHTTQHKCNGITRSHNLGQGGLQIIPNTSNRDTLTSPFSTGWFSSRVQYLYRASDLKAQGLKAGLLKSFSWLVDSTINTSTGVGISNFSIRIGCTSLQGLQNGQFELTSHSVFGPRFILVSKGWNKFQFDQEFIWDGNSNLIVEVCWDNQNSITNWAIQSYHQTNYPSVNVYHERNTADPKACGYSRPLNTSVLQTMPVARIEGCYGIRSNKLRYDWHPKSNGGFMGSTTADSAMGLATLNTARNYFVVVSDSAGVCKDTVPFKINVVSSYNTTPKSISTTCLDAGFVQLQAFTPGGKWSGMGIVNDSLGIWDPKKSGVGKHWVKYAVTGNACSSEDSIQINIAKPSAGSGIQPLTLCAGVQGDSLSTRLTGQSPFARFKGAHVDSIPDNDGNLVYFINPLNVSATYPNPTTSVVTYYSDTGCFKDTNITVSIYPQWDTTYLGLSDGISTYRTHTFCRNQKDTLFAAGGGAIWSLPNSPLAVVSSGGVFDWSRAHSGYDTLTLTTTERCPRVNKIPILVLDTIEIEVMEASYCFPNGCNGIPSHQRIDTIWLRVPKGPSIGGTGSKKLDPGGFNPQTEVKVHRALSTNSGWPLEDRSLFNNWSGSILAVNHTARFIPCQLADGSYIVSYQMPILMRNTGVNKLDFCYSNSSTQIEKLSSIPDKLPASYDGCRKNTVDLDAGKITGANYAWSTGGFGQKITAVGSGVYRVTISTAYCSSEDSTVVEPCLFVEDPLDKNSSIKLYPNPVSSVLHLSASDLDPSVQVVLINPLGQVVESFDFETYEGKLEAEINVNGLSRGNYFMRIIEGQNFQVLRFTVK